MESIDTEVLVMALKEYIEINKLSHREIAIELGVSNGLISLWLNGKSSPRGLYKKMLTEFLGLGDNKR